MKKRYFVAVIIAIVLVIGILAAVAFSSFGQGSHKSPFTIVNNSVGDYRDHVGLEDALVVLNSHDMGGFNQKGNYTVHYIHGEDIDTSGKARTWILAVKTNQSQFYFE
ncbi:MAG TPA: hypothetical protein VMC42_06605, partial [Methanoregulaceae archaeon]|nr:hypothetical protein [Methanoregulaceae archaeon]